MRFLFLMIFFCLCGGIVVGQSPTKDTATQEASSPFGTPAGTTDTAALVTDSSQAAIVNGSGDAPSSYESREPYIHQFRLGVDLSRAAFNILMPNRQSYEFQADYALRHNVYVVAEAGLGKGKVDYEHLRYQTNGFFVRLGVNKSFLDRLGPHDFDIGFLGARYGIGIGRRGAAEYFVPSPFGGGSTGAAPAQNFVVHWGELTGGVKVEVWRGVFLGWTIRGKFLFNAHTFETLSPNFIPGYGRGDKKTAFDFNFYLSYALRWGGQAGQ